MTTDPGQQQAFLAEARQRMSQAKIDRFLQENPNDYHRLKDVEGDLQGSAPMPAAPAGAPGGEMPSMMALNKIAAPTEGTGTGNAPGAMPPSLLGLGTALGAPPADQSTLGVLRPLGRRSPPMSALVLSGRAY